MRLAVPGVVALLCAAVFSASASAQVRCLSSFPAPGSRLEAPPSSLLLWVSEPVDVQLSQFHVLDLEGHRFDLTPKVSADGLRVEVPLRPLADGLYVVHYRAASVLNGHVSVGLYSFGVRASLRAPPRPRWLVWGLGAASIMAAAATGSVWAATLATASFLADWASFAPSTVPASWPALLRGGWVGLLLAGTQPGWALVLAAAVTGVWTLAPRPPRELIRLVGTLWLWFAAPLAAAAGGPLSLLSSTHGPVVVLMVVAYGALGLLTASILPAFGIRVREPRWTLLLLSLLLAAAWALNTAASVGQFFTAWLALSALCSAAYLWRWAHPRAMGRT